MKTINIIKIETVAIIVVLLLMATSCRTKQKAVEREAIKMQKVESVTATETIEADVRRDSVATSERATVTVTKDQIVELDPDSTGTVTREVEETPTGRRETYTGVKKIRIVDTEREENRQERDSVKLSEIDKSVTTKEEKSNTKLAIDFSERNTKVDIESTNVFVSFAIGIGIILLLLLLAYWLYRKFRGKIF